MKKVYKIMLKPKAFYGKLKIYHRRLFLYKEMHISFSEGKKNII